MRKVAKNMHKFNIFNGLAGVWVLTEHGQDGPKPVKKIENRDTKPECPLESTKQP
jgi:hypothetical protein